MLGMDYKEEAIKEALLEARYAFMQSLEDSLSKQFAEMIVGTRIDTFTEVIMSDYLRMKNGVGGGSIIKRSVLALVASGAVAMLLAACSVTDPVLLRNKKGDVVQCGPYDDHNANRGMVSAMREQQCISDFQRQGYERVAE